MIPKVSITSHSCNSFSTIKDYKTTTNHDMKYAPQKNITSFKGSINFPINLSRKHIDYGTIFHDGANIVGKSLQKANANGLKIRNANIKECNLEKSSFAYALLEGTNLTQSNFKFANLMHSNLKNIITKHTDFTCTNLTGSYISGDRLNDETNMQKANLCDADLRDADIRSINFYNAFYNDYTRFPVGFAPKKEHMRLIERGADFSNLVESLKRTQLRYSVFENVNFECSNLRRADIAESYFKNCNLHYTNLLRAHAKGTIFENCDFTGSDLKQINLKDAELINCDLRNCNLRGAVLKLHHMNSSIFEGALYDQFTEIEGFNPLDYGMVKIISPLEYYGIRS